MSKMKIRVKMMFWYTLLTTVLLAVFLPILYNAIASSLLQSERNSLSAVMLQVIANVESENNNITVQNNNNISNDTPTIIWNASGSIVYTNSDKKWVRSLSLSNGNVRKINQDGEDWLVYDYHILKEEKTTATIRICSSLADMENTLQHVILLIFSILPVYFAVTILGGLWIAKRSLKPISRITDIVKEIELNDLSQRITGINSSDEVGDLADTFNRMLDHLGKSFEKEKRFTSDASHELRTPIAVIMSNAEAALAMQENDNTKKALTTILSESQRMSVIISQLLMLTRGTEGKYKPNFEVTSLNIIIDGVLEQLQPSASRQNISLSYCSDEEIRVKIDQSLITQMMLNLISNAIKYGSSGGHVWINTAHDGEGYFIEVRDDGIGISEEDLPHIFDRFYRADTARDRTGSGLGLSIVKWIVDEHKGYINVKSQYGCGTSLFVYLHPSSKT